MDAGYMYALPTPAYDRVAIGPDKITRLQDRHGQFYEIGGLELKALVEFAFANRDRILDNPEGRFTVPLADNFGNDIMLYGDEIDAIIRRLGEVPLDEPAKEWNGGWSF